MRFKEEVEACTEEMENLRGRLDETSVRRYQELQNNHARSLSKMKRIGVKEQRCTG
jgi:DNA anti-recombination protein RmuC